MNVHDSEIIAGILEADGFLPAEAPEGSDVVLLVSCAVREHAETRVLGRTAQLGGISRKGSRHRPVLVLCGCVAQEHGGGLLDRFPDLDLVVGPDCYLQLPGLIRGSARTSMVEFRREDYEGVMPVRRDFPRAFVTIMRGCDNFCTYCIVPYVRGRERSRRADSVVSEVRDLSERGYREITLLGQNVNSYKDGETSFPVLLERVSEAAGDTWIRFVTSHPKDLVDDTVSVMAAHGNICRQLHLPLQSGSDAVLGRMRRGYTAAQYLEKIEALREAMPGIVLSTDMIAGFPGETEEDFSMTVDMMERIRYDYAFLFRYSERSGTAACGMDGSVPGEERLRRLGVLQDIQRRITLERSRDLIGRTVRVLVTGPARREGQQAARTGGNRMVVLQDTEFPPGSVVEVRIARADGWTHFGEPVEDR